MSEGINPGYDAPKRMGVWAEEENKKEQPSKTSKKKLSPLAKAGLAAATAGTAWAAVTGASKAMESKPSLPDEERFTPERVAEYGQKTSKQMEMRDVEIEAQNNLNNFNEGEK